MNADGEVCIQLFLGEDADTGMGAGSRESGVGSRESGVGIEPPARSALARWQTKRLRTPEVMGVENYLGKKLCGTHNGFKGWVVNTPQLGGTAS